MKNLILFVLALGLASCATVQDGPAPDPSVSPAYKTFSVLVGKRTMDDDWEPLQKQDALGIEFSSQAEGAAAGFEFGIQKSSDDDDFSIGGPYAVNVEASTLEIYGGVRKTWNTEPGEQLRPYIGAGISMVTGEVSAFGQTLDDSTVGVYAHAGVAFQVAETFSIGFDFRLMPQADLDIEGVDFDSSYSQMALVLGWSF